MKKAAKKRIFFFLGAVLALFSLGILGAFAQDEYTETLPEAYGDLVEAIPSEVADLLPDGLFSQQPEEALQAAETLTRPVPHTC